MNNANNLNMYLFEQLQRLSEDQLSNEEFEREIEKSKVVTNLAGKIIDNAKLQLEAEKFSDDRMDAEGKLPIFFGDDK